MPLNLRSRDNRISRAEETRRLKLKSRDNPIPLVVEEEPEDHRLNAVLEKLEADHRLDTILEKLKALAQAAAPPDRALAQEIAALRLSRERPWHFKVTRDANGRIFEVHAVQSKGMLN